MPQAIFKKPKPELDKEYHCINNNMDFVDPSKSIPSPYNGLPIRPKLQTYIRDNKQVVEAEYIDPTTGVFIRKAVVSIKDIPPVQK